MPGALSAARRAGKTVVVGGPAATSSPHIYSCANHLVLGEAEITLPRFLKDFAEGCPQPRYSDPGLADMTVSPIPRFDLLKLTKYLRVGIQWSRGCPFTCEFCDIIELFGRKPRMKAPARLMEELDALYAVGYRGLVHIVDDNLGGFRNQLRQLLPEIERWLYEHECPFEFIGETSIDLARDEELLVMLRRANFISIFVGIESPDENTLKAISKRQNIGRPIVDAVRRFQEHGIFVTAGFILGFDTDCDLTADSMVRCVNEAAIPVSAVGLLYALPGTQLERRLRREGRLPEGFDVVKKGVGDQAVAGLNFDPVRPRTVILEDLLKVIQTLYEPSHYFNRVLQMSLRLGPGGRIPRITLKMRLKELRALFRLIGRLGFNRQTARHFWHALLKVTVRNPLALRAVLSNVALYVHLGAFSRQVASRIRERLAREAVAEGNCRNDPRTSDGLGSTSRSVRTMLTASSSIST